MERRIICRTVALIGPSPCFAVSEREGWFVVTVFLKRLKVSTAAFHEIVSSTGVVRRAFILNSLATKMELSYSLHGLTPWHPSHLMGFSTCF